MTGGAYHAAGDANALDDTTKAISLRLTTKKKPVELTAPVAGAARPYAREWRPGSARRWRR